MTADALDGDEVNQTNQAETLDDPARIKHKVTVKNTIHLELIIQCFPLQVHLVAVLGNTAQLS